MQNMTNCGAELPWLSSLSLQCVGYSREALVGGGGACFLAHLGHWLMVSYCDNWLCVMRHQQLLQDQLSHNAGQKYSRMLHREHSAILSTFINLPFVIKTFVLSIFEWPFYICFTVYVS